MEKLVAVVLAAGKGTRMKSALPKVLHRVAGKTMLQQVLDTVEEVGVERKIVVVGFGGEKVEHSVSGVEFVHQKEQLGTGHAVKQVAPNLKDFSGIVMVLCGDTPLLTADTLKVMLNEHKKQSAVATVLTAIMPDATGYGRVIRNADGSVAKIVEHKDATEEECSVHEVNSGIYCFSATELFEALEQVTNDNAQGEYYLPDVLEILRNKGARICAVSALDFEETLGINSRLQLSKAEQILRRRKNEALMAAGVTIMDPSSTFIDMDVSVGKDTVIYPFTWIEGNSTIGENCEIGPNCRLQNMKIGNRVTGQFLYAHEAIVEDGTTLGQFVHIRPNSILRGNVKIGNFVEVKNSTVGVGSKIPHLAYIGDTDIGARVNMGCGTITVNYDGKNKYRTTIGDDAFIGCNSNLIAPVTVENETYVGAGSTITETVPEGALAIARTRQKNIDGWAAKRKK